MHGEDINPAAAFVVDPDTQHLYTSYGRGYLPQMERQKFMTGILRIFTLSGYVACDRPRKRYPNRMSQQIVQTLEGTDRDRERVLT